MAESHVVSGMVAKRSELAERIEFLQNEIDSLLSALVHIDGSIKLFDPTYNLRTIKGMRTNARNKHFNHGEFQRLTLDILRTSESPATSRDIVNEMIRRKGMDSTLETVQKLQSLILGTLHNLEKRGIVKSAKNEDGSRSQIKSRGLQLMLHCCIFWTNLNSHSDLI